MHDKTIIVTGATSGIGLVTAKELAGLGARVVLVVRNVPKGEEVAQAIRAAGKGSAEVVACDLASLASVRKAAAEILVRCAHIDVLVNNAGAVYQQKGHSSEGLELTFAANHLGPFLLTNLLLERIKATPGARIVNVASTAHQAARRGISFADLKAEKSYSPMGRYAESKLANILFTRSLSKRLEGTGVTANCLHPGVIFSGFGLNQPGIINFFYRLARFFMLTPAQGARTSIYLASSPEVAGVSGQYFSKCKPARTTRSAQDMVLAERLWQVSAELCGL